MLAHTRHRAMSPSVHVGSTATAYASGAAVIAVGAVATFLLLKVSLIGAAIVALGTVGIASRTAYEAA